MSGCWRRLGATGLLALGLVSAVGPAAAAPAAATPCYQQCPQVNGWLARRAMTALDNDGFRIGWSSSRRSALWVAYELLPEADRREVDPRPKGYTVDVRTRPAVRSESYRGSGFDRGHLAANGTVSRFFGPVAQQLAMHMSNIAPQTPRLNRGVWQRLEMAEIDVWLAGAQRVWVVTGPLWPRRPAQLSGGLPVPDGFYRIWVRERDGRAPTVTAFRVPQIVCGDEPPRYFRVPVADIALAAGLDFGPLEQLDEPELTAAERLAMDALPLRYARDFQKTPKPNGCTR